MINWRVNLRGGFLAQLEGTVEPEPKGYIRAMSILAFLALFAGLVGCRRWVPLLLDFSTLSAFSGSGDFLQSTADPSVIEEEDSNHNQ